MNDRKIHRIQVTTEQLGYIEMCVRQSLSKDERGAEKFGTALWPDCSLSHRLRIGADVRELLAEVHREMSTRDRLERA